MSNLSKRLATAGVVIPILILFIWFLPRWTILIPGGICIFAGCLEVMTMIGQSHSRAQYMAGAAVIVAFCSVLLLIARGDVAIPNAWTLNLCLTSSLLLFIGIIFYRPLETASKRLAGLFTALVYPGILLTLIFIIHNTRPEGDWWAFCILTTAFFCDTGAYFAGRAFGRHPLAPSLSPKKTIEGMVGGILGSLMATLAAHFIYLPLLPLIDAIVLGILGSFAAVIGDLVESLLKRSSGIKDAGKFFPGHGGMMDRIDGLLFVIPLFYIYINFFVEGL